jgi:hypothetical protein
MSERFYKRAQWVFRPNLKSMTNTQVVEVIVRHPIPNEELDHLKATIGTTRTQKPIAFIFGHGLWSNLEVPTSLNWLDTILDTIKHQIPLAPSLRHPQRSRQKERE